MFGKIHTEIFDSSLMAEGGWLPAYVFMCMVTLSDKDGYLRHDPRTLYRRIGLLEDDRVSFGEFMDAIEFLSQKDAMSNLPAHDGRRIVPVSELPSVDGSRGWLVVNKVHYRDKGGSLERRRASDAERQRRHRERKNNELGAETPKSHVTTTLRHAESAHTDTDTDTDTDLGPKRGSRSCPKSWEPSEKDLEWFDEQGFAVNRERETAKFRNHEYAKPMKRWGQAWRNWMLKAQEFHEERRRGGSTGLSAAERVAQATGRPII